MNVSGFVNSTNKCNEECFAFYSDKTFRRDVSKYVLLEESKQLRYKKNA